MSELYSSHPRHDDLVTTRIDVSDVEELYIESEGYVYVEGTTEDTDDA